MIMKKNTIALVLMLIIIVLTGCADVAQIQITTTSEPYGFFSGLWHGMVLPLSIWGSLLSDNIAIYGINNTGWWYDFGFIIGCFGGVKLSVSIRK